MRGVIHTLLTDLDVKPYTMIVAGISAALMLGFGVREALRLPVENFGERLPDKTAVADENEGDQCA
jgi:hypothetical protein